MNLDQVWIGSSTSVRDKIGASDHLCKPSMQHSLRTLTGGSHQSFKIPSEADRVEVEDDLARTIKSLQEKLERNGYRSKKQRLEDEKLLAKNISDLEKMHKYKRSVDHCQKRLDSNDYQTSRARQKDVETFSRNASSINVMMLCSQERAKAANVLKGRYELKFLR